MKLTFTTNKVVLAGCRQAGLVTKSDPPRMTKKGRLALLYRLISEIQRADLTKSKIVFRGGERYLETTMPFGEVPKKKKRARR